MITAIVKRLRRMSSEEASWRLRTLTRVQQQRVAAQVRRPRWNRAALARVLAPAIVDADLAAMIDGSDWNAVQERLLAMISSRPSRFVLDPGTAPDLRAQVLERWPDAAAAARTRADRIVDGRFDLLGYRDLSFASEAGEIDWHLDPVHGRRMPLRFWASVPYLDPQYGDHKIVWELNRQQYWLALGRALWLTGDARYGDAIVRHLEGWLAANPPLVGANWASMLELGFRSISWTWALHALLSVDAGVPRGDGGPWLVDMLVALDRQMTHVAGNLSHYFSPNTHLTGEALALYVVGHALPELARSRDWIEAGRRVLLGEIGKQIGADGGHAERSTHYHRYTLDFYLLALLTAERNGDSYAAAQFAEAAQRLATFMDAMCGSDGRMPIIGDDDGGMLWPITGREPADVRDSLAVAAVVLDRPELARWGMQEEAVWIAGPARAAAAADRIEAAHVETDAHGAHCAAAAFADTGYVTMRDSAGGHLVFDVGAHGYLNGGHAHADALAVTLSHHGHPLLIDPGTSTYTMRPELRDRMRSTASHNTVVVDGRSSSLAAGPFHWATRADARLHASRGNERFGWAEGIHTGYGDVAHRRSVVHTVASGWLIVDEITGRERHRADLHWHFDPAWTVTCEHQDCLRATRSSNDPNDPNDPNECAWVLHDRGALWLVHGDEETGLGWAAPAYGTLRPTWTARVTRTAVAPFAMVTWVGGGDRTTPRLERIATHPDPAGGAVAVRVTRDDVAWTTVLRSGEAPARETRGCGTDEFHTNARLLQYGMRGDAVIAVTLADFSHLLATRDGLLSVAAEDLVPDLHLVTDGSTLEAWSSAPPSKLRLQGAAVSRISRVRLNGIEQRRWPTDRLDTLVVSGREWAMPRDDHFYRNALCVA